MAIMVHQCAVILAGAGGLIPLITDIEIISTSGIGNEIAGIVFNFTGTGSPIIPTTAIHKKHKLVFTLMGNDDATSPVDHTGEWTASTDAGLLGSPQSSLWEVACTSITSGTPGTWDVQAAIVGTYVNLGLRDILWSMNRPGGKGRTPGTDTITTVFRIREVADTGNFDEFGVICTAIQT